MTLVEVIGSIVIISLLAVFLITVFSSAVTIVYGQSKIKKDNADAASGLENTLAGYDISEDDVEIDLTENQIQIDFGTTVVVKNGTYYKSKNADSNYTYYYFVSD